MAAIGFDRDRDPNLPPLPIVEGELSVASVRGTSRETCRVSASGSPEFVTAVMSAAADAAEQEHLR